jgi:YbbR domain-containing protein
MTPSLRELILNNLSWKVTSVVMAILIWLTIYSNQNGLKFMEVFKWRDLHAAESVRRSLPVTVITTATDMRRFTITPKEVEVTVRGESATLNKLKMSDLAAFVNLTDVNDDMVFQKRVNLYAPSNVVPISVVPQQVTVERVSQAEPAGNRSHQD